MQNYNSKSKIIIFLLIFTFYFLLFNLGKHGVLAENMESDSYKLKDTNLNMTSGEKSSENFKISDTVGQTGAGKYSSNGYIVKAGFQYTYSTVPFSFSISKTSINFASIMPERPATSSAVLTVSSGTNHGYSVNVITDGNLRKNDNTYIPQTSCDNPNNPCTNTIAKVWSSPSRFGFGYNLTGDDIPQTFVNQTYFRPFPTENGGNSPTVIMNSAQVGRNKQATITFKVNVAYTQEAGLYQNILKFVATASY